jgi:hypothetical protein
MRMNSYLTSGSATLSGSGTTAQRVAAEKQNSVGSYIPPMTRRLKCRIDPEQSSYTCMLPEMIDLLAAEEPKPKPAKIRAVSYEAAINQLLKRMRSSSSALT